jgi:hypothetical protein
MLKHFNIDIIVGLESMVLMVTNRFFPINRLVASEAHFD